MNKPDHHIFLCASYRVSGEPKGICHKKGSVNLLQYIEEEIVDRGITNVLVSSTGCLKQCDHGPIMVIYPDNIWIKGVVSEDAIDDVLDAIEDNNFDQFIAA